jgi:hypothetical protein
MPLVVGLDTETELLGREQGLAIPRLVCMSWAARQGDIQAGIVDRHHAVQMTAAWLRNPDVVLVGNNIGYDATVLCRADTSGELVRLFFDAYSEGRVICNIQRERLIHLARGQLDQQKGYYDLASMFQRYYGIELAKADTWRLRYGELYNVPITQWPHEAVEYPIKDAKAHLLVFEAQGGLGAVNDDVAQSQADFAFKLMTAWGVRTDPQSVFALEQDLHRKSALLRTDLLNTGILKQDRRGGISRNMKVVSALVEGNAPGAVRRTPTQRVQTSDEVLRESRHPALHNLADYLDIEKVVSTFLPTLKIGLTHPICSSVTTLKENGRTSQSHPNLQQLPRDGGVRECIVPRPGYVFIDGDYSTLEVRTFAQVLYWLVGGTTLKDLFGSDPSFDPHSRLGAQILGFTYEQMKAAVKAKDARAKEHRQMSKPANFGFQGGMGEATMIAYAKNSYNVIITPEQAKMLKREWVRSIPEVRKYFAHVSGLTRDTFATIAQFVSGRIRGGMGYTELANGYWSALANDGAKHAQFLISRDCYARPNSPLYGCRPVMMNHDQFVVEAPEHRAHEAAMQMRVLAEGGMGEYVPNIPIVNEPALMRKWSKEGGDPVYDRNGRLVPYEDRARGL